MKNGLPIIIHSINSESYLEIEFDLYDMDYITQWLFLHQFL